MPTVFVLDDAGVNPQSLSARLRAEGYHVLSMSGEAETLAALRALRADLLVVDATCVGGGAALIAALRRQEAYREMPILLLGPGAADPGEASVVDRVRSFLDPLSVPFN